MSKTIKFTPSIPSNSATWDKVNDLTLWMSPVERVRVRVRVASLIGTQPSVTRKGMKTVATDWRRPIIVVRIGRKTYIRDGHHRVTRARYLGQRTIAAYLMVVD